MLKTILVSTLIIFGLSGCFHQELMVPKKEVKKEAKKEEAKKIHHKVPKLNHSFYYN